MPRSNTRLFISLAVVGLFLALAFAIIVGIMTQAGNNLNNTNISSDTFTPQIVGERLADDVPNVEIDIEYPQISNASGHEAASNFNRIMKQAMIDTVSGLGDVDDSVDGESYFLGMDYEVQHNRNGLLSILMSGSIYLGGAHPNAHYYTILFDLERNQVISVSSLFTNETLGLEKLRDLSRVELNTRDLGDTDTMVAGSEATPENYQYFYVKDGVMTIVFPPYQVAAYAVGSQLVEIPVDALDAELTDGLGARLR